jgi:excisionase family DNA binding protein
MTYGSGASNVRLVGSSKPSQTVESVRVRAGGRVQPSQGIAGFSSPFAAPVLQRSSERILVPSEVERWFKVADVADRLGVSTATVYALCKRGGLAHIRVANAIRIGEKAIRAFLAAAAWS